MQIFYLVLFFGGFLGGMGALLFWLMKMDKKENDKYTEIYSEYDELDLLYMFCMHKSSGGLPAPHAWRLRAKELVDEKVNSGWKTKVNVLDEINKGE